jgi:hypothetical protein
MMLAQQFFTVGKFKVRYRFCKSCRRLCKLHHYGIGKLSNFRCVNCAKGPGLSYEFISFCDDNKVEA